MSNRKPNSAQARDVAFHLHSQTNPRRHAEIGPLIMTRGDGVYALENGLVIRALSDTIGLCPPLIINAAEIDELLGLFARTLRQVEDRLGPQTAAPPLAVPRFRQ